MKYTKAQQEVIRRIMGERRLYHYGLLEAHDKIDRIIKKWEGFTGCKRMQHQGMINSLRSLRDKMLNDIEFIWKKYQHY